MRLIGTIHRHRGGQMIRQVEISSFDLRFADYRLRNQAGERILLASISEKGVREPLQGVDMESTPILLNGFKRYRCAKKLGIGILPYVSLSNDPGAGIIELLRMSNEKGLNILEQARLITELKEGHHMSTADIASLLEKSKAWVSVRSGITKEMSGFVMEKIFREEFPAYAYMYVLRPFIRINRVKQEEIDEFVGLSAGHRLSIRDIELLANGYFKGSAEFREQLRKGDMALGLAGLRNTTAKSHDCTAAEQSMLRDLERTQWYMRRVTVRCQEKAFTTSGFFAQANLLAGGILRQMDFFSQTVKDFHDRSGKA
jgi:hypothetical protein